MTNSQNFGIFVLVFFLDRGVCRRTSFNGN